LECDLCSSRFCPSALTILSSYVWTCYCFTIAVILNLGHSRQARVLPTQAAFRVYWFAHMFFRVASTSTIWSVFEAWHMPPLSIGSIWLCGNIDLLRWFYMEKSVKAIFDIKISRIAQYSPSRMVSLTAARIHADTLALTSSTDPLCVTEGLF